MWILWVVLAIVVIFLLWLWGSYNGLVQARLQVKNSWSQIDVQLKRRFDLIPNLVETVKGYKNFERDTLEAVTKARTAVQQVPEGNIADRAKAEGELGAALGRLMVVVERYPELKANQNFLALQEELTGTENRISFSRQAYNDSVQGYNVKTQTFPSNIVANMFNFKKEEPFLQATENEAERKAPKVSF
ncbi:MAG TPA: LemA family protein [Dehalococcoidales bacterium]|nr:LemA family protein [Dehalococcoidales bacterium]